MWPNDVFESSRIQMATTLCGDLWVTGLSIYGEPPGQAHPYARENTERLIEVATDLISNAPGLRYVAGDMNFQIGELDAYNLLHHLGFRDLQDIAADRWGIKPENTCKSTTRKDFCFISPELQELLCGVTVQHDIWADHSVLVGTFQGGPKAIMQHWWRTPLDFPWPDQFATSSVQLDCDYHQNDPTDVYANMWKQIETSAVTMIIASTSTPKRAHFGRGHTMTTTLRQDSSAPMTIKPSRNGDVKPLFYGQSRQHAQWFRQLRRLQAYCRFVKAHPSDNQHAHGTSLWRSILLSTGFHPSFGAWWHESNQTKLDGAPEQIPLVPPCHLLAESISLLR